MQNFIHIQIAQPEFSPGDQINGVVVLMLAQSYHGDTVVLEFQGVETTQLIESQTRGSGDNAETYYVTHNGKASVIDFSMIISQYNSPQIPPG